LCIKTLFLSAAIEEVRQVDVSARGLPPIFVDGKIVTKEEEAEMERRKVCAVCYLYTRM